MTRRARLIVAAVVAAGVSWLVPWALAPAPFHYAPPMATLETAAFAVAAAAPEEAAGTEPATTDEGADAALAESEAETPSGDADATDNEAGALPALPELPAGAGAEKAAPDWAARLAALAPLGEAGAGFSSGAPDFSLPETGGGAGGAGGAPVVGQSEGPQLLAPPDPAAYYPYAARANGTTGNTLVRLSVGGDGAVTAVEVVESAPPGVFEDAARRLGRALRFRPAMANGRPVPARVELRLNWRLD